MSTLVYVVYDGDPGGPLDRLAQAIGEGASRVPDTDVILHRPHEATVEQLVAADAIVLGSPNWHGMTADLKKVIDQTGKIWEQGKLVGKVGAAFTSGWSRSGGQEITLLTLLQGSPTITIPCASSVWMVIVGLPWSKRMVKSGSYYGPTAVGGPNDDDLGQARALGHRVARYAAWLQAGRGSEADEIEGGVFYRE